MSNLPVPVTVLDDQSRAARLAEAFATTKPSPHTRKAYKRDLTVWLDWCAATGVDPFTARHAFVLHWLADREAAGDSDATRARRLAALSSWYRWMGREGLVNHNPADLDSKERPHVNRDTSPAAVLSLDEASALVAAAEADSPRTAALVTLLAVTGARIAEILGADIEDIVTISGQPHLKVMGKGRRQRDLPLIGAYDALEQYLTTRTDTDRLPALAAGARPRRPLLATRTGKRLDQAYVWRTLRRLGAKAGLHESLADRLSAHALRHSYATDLLREGRPIRDVQYAMGHSTPVTTERYDHGKLDPANHPTYSRAAMLARARRGRS